MTSESPETAESAEAAAGTSPAAAGSGDAWRKALATRRTQQREGQSVPGAQASHPPQVARRNFILGSFWTGMGVTLMGSLGLFLDFWWPRNVEGFGGPVPAGNVADYPVGGVPFHDLTGQFWIVNLDPSDYRGDPEQGPGSGLLALWHRCPHLGCTVPWRKGFRLKGFEQYQDWFRCPCHGSTYTKAGVRFFGPTPRPMDTMKIEVDDAGNVTVQTGQRTNGGADNPQRAGPPYWGGPVEST